MSFEGWFESIRRASLEGAIAILAVWILCRAFRKMPAWAQCWLWRLAFAKILFSLFSTASIEAPLLPARERLVVSAEGTSVGMERVTDAASEPPKGGTTYGGVVPAKAIDRKVWLFGVWAVGLFVAGCFVVGQFVQAWRLRRSGLEAAPDLDGMVARLAVELGTSRPRAFRSTTMTRPLLLGVFRPAIIFPTNLKASEEQMTLMLAHELAHLKRRDLIWNWLAASVQAALWFHPLVWLGAREWRLSQEMACDEFALRNRPASAPALGKVLLDLVSQRNIPAPRMVAAGIIETKSTLERRLNGMKLIQQGIGWPRAFAMALVAVAVIAALPWKVVAQKEPPAAAPKEIKETSKAKEAGETKVPEETERSLLQKELAIAQKQLSTVRKQFEFGAASTEEVSARQRDVLHVQRELAELDGDRKATAEAIKGELALLTQLEAAEKNRVKSGVASEGDVLKLEREILQLQRRLKGLKGGEVAMVSKKTRTRHYDIYPIKEGVVSQLDVKPGDKVKAGQLLFAVDLPEWKIKERTAAAQVQIAQAEFRMKKLEVDQSIREAMKHPNEEYVIEKGKLEIQRAEAELDIVQQKLEQVRLESGACIASAPHEGVVDLVECRVGGRVTPTSLAVRIIYQETAGEEAGRQ